jgi:hypothetical protein
MFVVDLILYLIIALYLDAIVPQSYGTRKPWYFIFQPSFWILTGQVKSTLPTVIEMKGHDNPDLFETPNKDQISKMSENKGVRIHELSRKFNGKYAVQGLNAFFYKNEVTGRCSY